MTDITKVSQSEAILDYMMDGNRINPLTALNYFGCFRLAARIADIKKMGAPVKSEIITVTHGNGMTKRYKEYFIE